LGTLSGTAEAVPFPRAIYGTRNDSPIAGHQSLASGY